MKSVMKRSLQPDAPLADVPAGTLKVPLRGHQQAVLAAMEDGGFVLGGEQSGHIINARYSTTGDGVLSAILLLDLIRRSESTLSKLSASVMTRMPQVLRNVRVAKKPIDVASLIADEPLVRIMVEAESQTLADGVAARLEQAVIART